MATVNYVFLDKDSTEVFRTTDNVFVNEMATVVNLIDDLGLEGEELTIPLFFDKPVGKLLHLLYDFYIKSDPPGYRFFPSLLELATYLDMPRAVEELVVEISHCLFRSYFSFTNLIRLTDDSVSPLIWMPVFNNQSYSWIKKVNLLGISPVWDECILAQRDVTERVYSVDDLGKQLLYNKPIHGLKLWASLDDDLFLSQVGRERVAPMVTEWHVTLGDPDEMKNFEYLANCIRDNDVTVVVQAVDENLIQWLKSTTLMLPQVSTLHLPFNQMHLDLSKVFPNVKNLGLFPEKDALDSIKPWGHLCQMTLSLFTNSSKCIQLPAWVSELTVQPNNLFLRVHCKTLSVIGSGLKKVNIFAQLVDEITVPEGCQLVYLHK